MAYECKMLADSIASGVRLTTMQVTGPRIVLAEFNTHRTFSRNSASSRAIPVEKRIQSILDDPFIPEAFGVNKRGMQAGADLDGTDNDRAREAWLAAMYAAIGQADALAKIGVHKQWANRLIEPFAWHTIIVTATEWANFFALRISPEAQPEIRRMAEMMKACMAASTPVEREPGDWHLPLVNSEPCCYGMAVEGNQHSDDCEWHREVDPKTLDASLTIEQQVKLSVARCARVSYLTHDGKRDVDADLALYERLLKSGHISPFEHAVKVASDDEIYQYALLERGPTRNTAYSKLPTFVPVCIGNLSVPWLQHRKMIAGEAVFQR